MPTVVAVGGQFYTGRRHARWPPHTGRGEARRPEDVDGARTERDRCVGIRDDELGFASQSGRDTHDIPGAKGLRAERRSLPPPWLEGAPACGRRTKHLLLVRPARAGSTNGRGAPAEPLPPAPPAMPARPALLRARAERSPFGSKTRCDGNCRALSTPIPSSLGSHAGCTCQYGSTGTLELPPRRHRLFWWKEALIAALFYAVYSWTRNQFGSNRIAADGIAEHAFDNAKHVIRVERSSGSSTRSRSRSWFLALRPVIRAMNIVLRHRPLRRHARGVPPAVLEAPGRVPAVAQHRSR